MIGRRFFAVASAISLPLCLAAVALWVRTHWASDRVKWNSVPTPTGTLDTDGLIPHASVEWEVVTRRCDIQFYRASHVSNHRMYWMFAAAPGFEFSSGESSDSSVYTTMANGFGLTREQWTSNGASHRDIIVVVPWWAVFTILMPLPLITTMRNLRRRRGRLISVVGVFAMAGAFLMIVWSDPPRWVLIVTILVIIPFGAVGLYRTCIGRRTIKRRESGQCPTCGYSLTGNTSGTCPECGTPVPKEPAEKSPRQA